MDEKYYKEKIIKMLDEIENVDYLSKIYHYVIVKYRKEIKKKEEAGS